MAMIKRVEDGVNWNNFSLRIPRMKRIANFIKG